MSSSKLETLPNEVLVEIFEKYINGLDLVTAFAFQLNRRIDSLILRCQRFNFDFIRCQHDDFNLCLNLLPAYANRIEELALSEHKTPGQIFAFLHSYPNFTSFPQLRRLYFHVDLNNCDPQMIQNAFTSLATMNIDTLAVKIVGLRKDRRQHTGLELAQFFQLPTVKKLAIATDVQVPFDFPDQLMKPSNIEYFTFADPVIQNGDFGFLLRSMTKLKHLNVRLTSEQYDSRQRRRAELDTPFPLMPMMKTCIVHVEEEKASDFILLAHHLKAMPRLRQLEVTAPYAFFNASVWEDLITSSLTNLVHLRLYATSHSHDDEEDVPLILDPFKTPFWIERPNFVFMLMQFADDIEDEKRGETIARLGRPSFNVYTYRFWTGARRSNNFLQNPMVLTEDWGDPFREMKDDYFHYSEYLVCPPFNADMMTWLTEHVNCAKIKHFEGLFCQNRTELSIFPNLQTVRLSPESLTDLYKHQSQVFPSVRYLDLCAGKRKRDRPSVDKIRQLFPNVEHLVLKTESLEYVPSFAYGLRRLRSLTCIMNDRDPEWEYDTVPYHLNVWAQNLRRTYNFFFHREEDYLIIWLDKVSIDNTEWHTIQTERTFKVKRHHYAASFHRGDTSDSDEDDYHSRDRRFRSYLNDLLFDERS